MPVESTIFELSDEEIEFLNAIFDVVRAGHLAKLTSLLDQGIPVDFTDAKGDSLLILAAYHEHTQLVELLLSRGANIDALNDRGQTPLVCAVFRNNEEITKLLLDAGADPQLGHQTPAEVADFFNLPHMKELLAGK